MENTGNTHIITYDEVSRMRKSGDALGAYNASLEVKRDYPGTQWVDNMLGWCLYDMLKGLSDYSHADEFLMRLQELSDLSLDSGSYVLKNVCWPIRTFAQSVIGRGESGYDTLSSLFGILAEINLDPIDENYAILLGIFLKAKTWPDLKGFLVWWDLANLKEKDFAPFVMTDGRKIMSVGEQAYIAYAKLLLAEIEENKDDRDRTKVFIAMLRDVVKSHADLQYPPYFLAKILMAIGEKDEAQKALLPFAIKKQRDYWVWDCLGDVVEDDDLRLSCYCKALSCKVKDAFLCKMHLKMCDLLLKKGLYNEARTELHVAIGIYRSNGWRLPSQYVDYCDESWYRNAAESENNKAFYNANLTEAEMLLYSEKPKEVILVTYLNQEKKIANYVNRNHKEGFFSYKQLPKKYWPKIHGIYECVMEVGEGGFSKVHMCKRVDDVAQYNGILMKKSEGILKKIDSGAAFVGDVYVPASMTGGFESGEKVVYTAYINFNKNKRQWGWAADIVEKI